MTRELSSGFLQANKLENQTKVKVFTVAFFYIYILKSAKNAEISEATTTG